VLFAEEVNILIADKKGVCCPTKLRILFNKNEDAFQEK
jgi:hypothetical protein